MAAFGFPPIAMEKPVRSRWIAGTIQSRFVQVRNHFRYEAFELGFPAFHGLSGAPLLLNDTLYNTRDHVVGVVTDAVEYSSELKGQEVKAHWAVAASLTPLHDWITEQLNAGGSNNNG